MVLADTEKNVRENTIIAFFNTTISITRLAKALQRPENLFVCNSSTQFT